MIQEVWGRINARQCAEKLALKALQVDVSAAQRPQTSNPVCVDANDNPEASENDFRDIGDLRQDIQLREEL